MKALEQEFRGLDLIFSVSLFDRVAERSVSGPSFCSHASQNRHSAIDVVDNENVRFPVMLTVEPANVLGQRSFPGDRHGQEQRIEPAVIEPFSDIPTCREYQPLLIVRYTQSRFGDFALGSRHAERQDFLQTARTDSEDIRGDPSARSEQPANALPPAISGHHRR